MRKTNANKWVSQCDLLFLPPLQRLKIELEYLMQKYNSQVVINMTYWWQLEEFYEIFKVICVWPLSIVPNCLAQHVTEHKWGYFTYSQTCPQQFSTTEASTKFGGGAPSNQDRGEALSKIRRRGSIWGDGSPCNQMKEGRPTLKWEDSNGLTALGEAVSANWSWSPNENASRAIPG